MKRWGALPSDWEGFSWLLPDIWPTVNNPHARKGKTRTDPSGGKVGSSFSKVPSRYGGDGQAYRLTGWTQMTATEGQRIQWMQSADLGFGAVCRTIRGIDLDIDDEELAEEVDAFISDFFGELLPARRRYGSPRRLLLYRFADKTLRRKVVIHTAHGDIEFQHHKQFIVLAGVHHSGQRQVWPDGIPASLADVPAITGDEYDELIAHLLEEFGTTALTGGGASSLGPADRDPDDADDVAVADMLKQLQDRGMFRGTLDNGMISVKCPWQHLHKSTDGALDPELDKTVLMPPGLGGYTQWGFRCVHDAGHGVKTFQEFTDELNILTDDFPLVTAEPLSPPQLRGTNKKGISPPTAYNIQACLNWPGMGVYLMHDTFHGTTFVSYDQPDRPRELRDTDYTEIQIRLDTKAGIPTATTTAVREATNYVAELNARDAALEWAGGLVWDGTDRLTGLHHRVLGMEDTPYGQAVVNYIFTALAGRCITPGVKADMVPVLIGRQGCRKSTFIERLAPLPGSYANIDLGTRDDDLSRELRGKLVVESGELRGFSMRAEESLKDWITRTEEVWVPKYKEHVYRFKRRFLLIGSTNAKRFLSDPSGARRWLPMEVCQTRDLIDTNYIEEHRDQLWAQGLSMYRNDGIAFNMAEILAADIHPNHYAMSGREATIRNWLANRTWDGDGFNSLDVSRIALNQGSATASTLNDIDRTMLRLGYEQDDMGNWQLPFL